MYSYLHLCSDKHNTLTSYPLNAFYLREGSAEMVSLFAERTDHPNAPKHLVDVCSDFETWWNCLVFPQSPKEVGKQLLN